MWITPEQEILQSHLGVGEARGAPLLGVRGVQDAVAPADREPEVRGDALLELDLDLRLLALRSLDVGDRRERQFVGHGGILDGEGGREESLPGDAVGPRDVDGDADRHHQPEYARERPFHDLLP